MSLPLRRRRLILVTAFAAVPLLLLSLGEFARSGSAKQATAQLRITVHDTAGEPLEAVVQAINFDPNESVEEALERGWRTDQPLHSWEGLGRAETKGTYHVDDVPAGRVWVTAFAQGYFPGEAEATVELKAGETLEIALTLEPARTVTGRLVDASGAAVWIGDKEEAHRFGFLVNSVRLRASYVGVSRPAIHEGETLHAAWQLRRQQIMQRARMHTPIEVETNVDGQVGAFRLGNLDPQERVELEVLLLPHGPHKTLEVATDTDEPQTVALPDVPLGRLEVSLRRYDGSPALTGTVSIRRTDRAISSYRFDLDDHTAPYDPQQGRIITALPAGEYEVQVNAEDERDALAQATVTPEEITEVTLELGAKLPLAVRVVTHEGDALAGARVLPVGAQTPWMRATWVLRRELPDPRTTDEQGRVAFEPLRWTGLILRVDAEGYETRVVLADLLALLDEEEQERIIALAPERTGEVHLEMQPWISGQDLDGERVTLGMHSHNVHLENERAITLEADGRGVARDVPVGAWSVRCPRSRERLKVTVRETSPAVVRLGGKLQEVPVELQFEQAGGPLNDVLFASIRGRDVRVRERVEPNRAGFTTLLPPGTHELYVGTSDRRNLFPEDPVRFWRMPLTIPENADGTVLHEVNLPARTLRGVVRNEAGEGVPRATVMAVGESRTTSFPQREESQRPRLSTTTDAEGRFTLRGLEYDASYRVWAHLMQTTPETDEAGLSVAVRDLPAAEREDVTELDLTLAQGGAIDVVLDAYPPLHQETAKLHLRDEQGRTMPQTLLNRFDISVHNHGRARIPHVPPGRYVLQVEVDGHAFSRHEVRVTENETVRVTPRVGRESVLLLRLADEEGEPVAAGSYTVRNEAGEDVTPLRGADADIVPTHGAGALFGATMRAEPHLLPIRKLAAGTYVVEVSDPTGAHRATVELGLEAAATKEQTLTLR